MSTTDDVTLTLHKKILNNCCLQAGLATFWYEGCKKYEPELARCDWKKKNIEIIK